MIGLPPSVRIYLATCPADMRKAYDGLAALVKGQMRLDPYSGYLFVFFNKRKNLCKILFWDRDGYALLCKRLERGYFTFTFNRPGAQASLCLSHFELSSILEGVDISKVTRGKRYARPLAV